MNKAFRLSDYQVRIGNEDVIERHLLSILSDDPESGENQEKAQKELEEFLKEMRVRVVCNSCLNPLDVQTARAAKWEMHREWCASLHAEIGKPMKGRLQRLYEFLDTGLLKVRVLPDEAFGLVHGKAGVITRTDGSRFGHHHRP